MTKLMRASLLLAGAFSCLGTSAGGQVLHYGDEDVLGTGTYPGDPKAGATLVGLPSGVVTYGAAPLFHGFPFDPSPGEFPGTDQIYVGSTQTGSHDGYSGHVNRLPGPQVLQLDYSSLVAAGQTVDSFTLGVAFDDFQFLPFQQAFIVTVNGTDFAPLRALANSLDQSGPVVQFITIGIDPSILSPSGVLTLSIDQGGDGGDGWAVDFLTVGVTTVPTPGATALLALSGLLFSRRSRSR